MGSLDYKDVGVNRDAAYSFVDSIAETAKASKREEILSEIGDFGGFFQAPKHMKDPIFCAATDGVGTKLLLAEQAGAGAHRVVGQDVVAMCVNDLVACRAEPLIFLDYLGVGKLKREVLDELLIGIVGACKESGCSLIGGETAQMPGFYPDTRYDVAGFSVGVLERSERLSPQAVLPGDFIFGMEADGFHSNGFSLIRKVMEKESWTFASVKNGVQLQDFLLRPTRLYVRPMLEIFKTYRAKGAAHITGGGLIDNLPRCFDESRVRAVIKKSAYPEIAWVQSFVEAARLSEPEAFSTWNLGIGFCFVLGAEDAEKLRGNLDFRSKFRIRELGVVEAKAAPTDASVVLV